MLQRRMFTRRSQRSGRFYNPPRQNESGTKLYNQARNFWGFVDSQWQRFQQRPSFTSGKVWRYSVFIVDRSAFDTYRSQNPSNTSQFKCFSNSITISELIEKMVRERWMRCTCFQYSYVIFVFAQRARYCSECGAKMSSRWSSRKIPPSLGWTF